jgi:hypothetical protein
MKAKLFDSLRLIALSIIFPFALSFTLTLSGCDKIAQPEEEKEEEEEIIPDIDVEPEEIILDDYIFVGKSEELGDWDCSVLGLDGLAVFYKFQEKSLPDEIRIWDGNEAENEKSLKAIVKFNDEGLPHSIIAGNYTFVFANFNENKFDVAIFADQDELSFIQEVESKIDWDEYRAEMSVVGTRAFNMSHSLIKWVNAGVGALGCALSIASAPTGVGVALAAISCTGAIISITDLFIDNMPTSVTYGNAVIGHYANLANCAAINNPIAVSSCLTGLISNMTQVGDLVSDDRREDIGIADGALISGFGEIKVTLTWDFVADIDLHIIEPSGNRIYFANAVSTSGGFLDFDNRIAYGPENIYWEDAPEGTYHVYVDHYAGETGGNYTVFVQTPGGSQVFRGHIGIDDYIFITSFNRAGLLSNTRATDDGKQAVQIRKIAKTK